MAKADWTEIVRAAVSNRGSILAMARGVNSNSYLAVVLVRKEGARVEYIVWSVNLNTQGCYSGSYHQEEDAGGAYAAFNKKVAMLAFLTTLQPSYKDEEGS